MKKICIVTATRAEYGLLKPLMKALRDSNDFKLQILVTGTHLSPEFGLTYRFLEEDGFVIDEKVEMLLSADTPTSIVKSMGLGMVGYASALSRLTPDALVILGDRYEILTVASSATIFKIPVIHLHGGEITEGAYDDSIRHAITKLSSLHFTSTERSRLRVIQMGESPNNVFNVGAIGIDNIHMLDLWSEAKLEQELGIALKKHNFQVTFHPETMSESTSKKQFQTLLDVIDKQDNSFFVFTKANADTDGRVINQMIDQYVNEYPRKAVAYHSLGTQRFLSIVKICDAIVGNSSSGIIEAPSLNTATINIGERQKGREQALSVINVPMEENALLSAFERVKTNEFKELTRGSTNPYGDGNTTQKILKELVSINLTCLLPKSFYNIPT